MQRCFQSKYSNISAKFCRGLHFSAFHLVVSSNITVVKFKTTYHAELDLVTFIFSIYNAVLWASEGFIA